jgi:penicillin-binding protein 1A
VAGKTGTTTSFTDAWFDGMVPGLTTAVWVGYPKTTASMYSVHGIEVFGGTFPAEIWHDFMSQVVKKCDPWPTPKEPFVAQPFFGRYSSTGAPSGGTDSGTYVSPQTGTPQGTGTTGTGNGNGTGTTQGTGGQKYPPDQYASPPQQAPQTQAPPGQGGGTAAPQGGNGTG